MEDEKTLTGDQVTREIEQYPAQMSDEYNRAWEAMSSVLNDDQLTVWAQAGLELARQTVRSWEAAGQYFKVSPKVVSLMPFNYFIKWTECGSALCRESPALAICYFASSPGVTALLRSRHIDSWANLGSSLYKGTWKSSTLSCKFFEASPALLASLTVLELGRFVAFLDSLSSRSYDLSIECLDLGQKVFPVLGEGKDAFLSLLSSLSETNWRQVKGFFEAAARSLPRIKADQRLRFLNVVGRLREGGYANVPTAMLDISRSMEQLDEESHSRLLELAEGLLEVSVPAMPEFIKSCPPTLERVSMSQLEKWYEQGVRLLEQNSDGGLAYFRLESARSQEVLEALSSSIEFTRIKDVMEMYCRALAGAEVSLSVSEELAEKGIGWVSGEAPSTEGSSVFVPSQVDRYATKQENFGWFKVVSTHQVAHLEFGSFQFEFERPSTQFEDMRPMLGGTVKSGGDDDLPDVDGGSAERGWVTDLQRFFDIFEDRRLALDVFTVVEDGRLDARVKSEYPGINQTYERVQEDSLQGRPEIESLPAREALLEVLVRISLQRFQGLSAPKQYVEEVRKAIRIAVRAVKSGATVEDTAEATLRIYAIIAEVPNIEIPSEDWQSVDMDEDQEVQDVGAEDKELLQMLIEGMGSGDDVEGEQEYSPNQEVDYRGDFKPELAQLLTRLRMQSEEQEGEPSAEPITQAMLEELLKNSAELDLLGPAQNSPGSFVDNMLKEVGLNAPNTPELGQGPLVHIDEEGSSLDPSEPQTFVYDEWDFRADDYKPRWCIVRQKTMAEGDPAYYSSTLQSYGPLVDQIRRQFELMVPEMLRKVRKLQDGDELDIDDVVEAFVDIKTGVGPSEKLYWRRNKVQRDVAVVFLLDTSASTAEAIDESRKAADDWQAPDDPVEYMVWLRNRRGEGMRRTYKRIIDLEKEAMVLLIHALESIGDVYGIYGFSGYGRENVEFYVVKDVNEEMSDKVKSRIDRIAPLHATRMGPAIRHATSKLEMHEARTKLLFLISDGRPQDRGYSREGVEKEYAVHDTKMALDEAKSKDITAFCLTVDKNGHDYLQTMCQDMGYEVLDDIYALPRRLVYLYRRLTT